MELTRPFKWWALICGAAWCHVIVKHNSKAYFFSSLWLLVLLEHHIITFIVKSSSVFHLTPLSFIIQCFIAYLSLFLADFIDCWVNTQDCWVYVQAEMLTKLTDIWSGKKMSPGICEILTFKTLTPYPPSYLIHLHTLITAPQLPSVETVQ